MGGTCDREELAWVTLGKSSGLGDGQYNQPLPWSGPMENGFNLRIQKNSLPRVPRPLINAQTHPQG